MDTLDLMKDSIPKGLRAVVTGAGGGLGRAYCLELAAAGARIVAADLNEESAKETARLVGEAGGEALGLVSDVAKWESVEAMASRAEEFLGDVDLLVNNAGVAVRGTVDGTSQEDWDWIMGVNVWGVVNGCRAFLPKMRARGTGYIVNVSSIAGLVSPPNLAPYNVSKAAVVSLTETLYCELAGTKVNVCVVCPTFFRTDILNSGRGEMDDEVLERVGAVMDRSRVQAPEVARRSLQTVFRGKLYCIPMGKGLLGWRLKRLLPRWFHGWLMARGARD